MNDKIAEAVENRTCTNCGGHVISFNDDLSRKEYAISGMCQMCQDGVFTGIKQ